MNANDNADDICTAFNGYKIMWLYAMFDLPVQTKQQRRHAALFRKNLIKDGFSMFQYSVYIRHCASGENAEVHRKRVQRILPDEGSVTILSVTDKQFGNMMTFYGKKTKPAPPAPAQLELF